MTNQSKRQDNFVSKVYAEAQQAKARNWSIIPINLETKKPDFALIKSWKAFQKTPASSEQLESWKDANGFAVVTGKISGLVVLDVDPKGFKTIQGKHIPITPTAQTPRGIHYYFKYSESLKSINGFLLGLDLKADGGYVLLPGADNRYWHVTPEETDYADVPSWIIETLADRERHINKHSNIYVSMFTSSPTVNVVRFNGEKINHEKLWEWANNRDIALSAAKLMGLPTEGLESRGRTKHFRCILPGHAETKPSACLSTHPETGGVLYTDWHRASGHHQFSLVDVYASISYGETKRLSKAELATWQLRLCAEIGVFEPMKVDIKPLPEDASRMTKKVYEGFVKLLGCRWRYDPYKPTPFSRKFAAAWCGISESSATKAIKALHIDYGCIRIVDQHGYLRLWLPKKA